MSVEGNLLKCHLRRTRLPTLSHFLLTSDTITPDDDSAKTANPLALPPRTHPPPLYYLPAVLLPSQAKFLEQRVTEVFRICSLFKRVMNIRVKQTKDAAEKEWESWEMQRKEGYDEVKQLRVKVEEEEKRTDVDQVGERYKSNDGSDGDARMEEEDTQGRRPSERDKERGKEGDATMPTDGDDAVEY